MTITRYREARTLVRGLRRLPHESRDKFKAKINRLRRHFQQFNVRVSELCQWLMALRPGGKNGGKATHAFWEFFLTPKIAGEGIPESDADRLRLAVFRVVARWSPENSLEKWPIDGPLKESIQCIKNLPRTPTADKLFKRLEPLHDGHRLVLLKAAAEWIVARYQRGFENWGRQHKEWMKEKDAWEAKHPELTPEIREMFTDIFRKLEIRRKNPRVCPWDRLKNGRDDCEYAGEKIEGRRHAPLCKKYQEFLGSSGRDSGSIRKFFVENAKKYLRIRNRRRNVPRKAVMKEFLSQNRKAVWFEEAWIRYLKTLNLREETLLNDCAGNLPHCLKSGEDCTYNPHTNDCNEYKKLMGRLDPAVRELEPLYRRWRKDYLAGPRKPSFRYPSSANLPMPKIFGSGFFDIDFERSVLRLRLDDMREGEFLEFGFRPWPEDYDRQPKDLTITSVHVNFIGARARAGFRFDVSHRPSRFGVTQDELDVLRRQVYPRQTQDQEFLDAARRRLLESFQGREDDLKLLAVDLGTSGAYAVVFHGRKPVKAEPLKVNKLDRIQAEKPKGNKSGEKNAEAKGLGLGEEHVGLHLQTLSDEVKKIARKRNKLHGAGPDETVTLGDHDLRRLTRHLRWMLRDWVRLNARQIINIAEREGVDLIVFESSRGFKAPGYDSPDLDKKRRVGFFAHGAIKRKVAEKAVERGMRVITVPYKHSSQVCGACGAKQKDKTGTKKRKTKKGVFACEREDCAFHDPGIKSDENAARVIGRVFWGEITLPVDDEDLS